ncbi:NAC domain-containing protein 6 [Cardamine amara subsp. amara]|uniref:NAC domain-containing protein 6 n=1 Tax=Cardamine amara subsp. amara TaxID=228776 RepID=A0ABD1AIQ1_CARAN
MADPSDLKFFAEDMKLVDYYLRNRVSTGKSNFITDINLYEEEPWLLPHVYHSQFYDKEWFYFVTRTRRARTTPKRTVPGHGGSKGGAWTTTTKQKTILDNNQIVIGYKSELSYHKKIDGKTKEITTGWCMTEYSLASPDKDDDLFQEVVLCHIREKKGIAEQFRFRPEINNNVVVEQPPQLEINNDVVEQPPELENIDNNINIVSDVIVPAGVDSAIGLQSDEDDHCVFEDEDCWINLDLIYAILDERDQQQPPILPQDINPPDQDMEEYADTLENMLEDHLENILEVEDDVDDDEATQQQQQQHAQIPLLPELGQDSRSRINSQLVFMEDEYVDQDLVFYLDDQNKSVGQAQQQSNHNFQDIARDQEMTPTVTNNAYGYQMQEADITSGFNQDSSCSSATQEQGRKRRWTF